MALKIEDTEIRTDEMVAEGTSPEKPEPNDIIFLLNDAGYKAMNIDIWLDRMTCIWRWVCDIKKWEPTQSF